RIRTVQHNGCHQQPVFHNCRRMARLLEDQLHRESRWYESTEYLETRKDLGYSTLDRCVSDTLEHSDHVSHHSVECTVHFSAPHATSTAVHHSCQGFRLGRG